MVSAANPAANRRNAQNSTGPRPAQGKTAVRLNALKHGLTAQHAPIPFEEVAEFHALLGEFQSHYRPISARESFLVLQIVTAVWHMYRLERTETRLFHCYGPTDPRLFANLDRLARQDARHERAFYLALHTLQDLQDKNEKTNPPYCPDPLPPSVRNQEMTKQTHPAPPGFLELPAVAAQKRSPCVCEQFPSRERRERTRKPDSPSES